MDNRLYHYFTEDHRKIEQHLEQAIQDIQAIQMEYYELFRIGILTHIKMEEKVLFLAAQKSPDFPTPLFTQLRLEHGAITALMVPPPTPELIQVLKQILAKHDLLEEQPGGMYDACVALTQDQTEEILTQLNQVAKVPIRPFNDAPFALEAAKRALLRAGFDYDAIVAEKDS